MIGDVPNGAPRRCRRGKHIGQENGGTMVYICPRCGGDYWQEADLSDVTRMGDALIAAGLADEALAFARQEIGRRTA